MQTILLGKQITSEEAVAAGLACEVFPDGDLLNHTLEAAKKIAEQAPEATALAKEAICRGAYDRPIFSLAHPPT